MSEPTVSLSSPLVCTELPAQPGPERPLPLWDRAGVLLSAVCLVHCLVLPLLAATLPLLTEELTHGPLFHGTVLSLAFPLAAVAFTGGYRTHRRTSPALLGAAGMTLLVLGMGVAAGKTAEVALAITGGLLLAGAHWINHRLSSPHHRG
jgi:hypothetical protein